MNDGGPGTSSTARELTAGYFVRSGEGTRQYGALLVVNAAGDPIDFVYTDPLDLRPIVRALLGERADSHVVLHVLTEPLLAKLSSAPSLLLYDDPALLQRDVRLSVPCVVMAAADSNRRVSDWTALKAVGLSETCTLWAPTQVVSAARGLVDALAASLAPVRLNEPFARVRAALQELRARP